MILVTGATGLVGSHLVLQLLEQGQKVKALFRNEANKENVRKVFEYYQKSDLYDRIFWISGDILDIPSLEDAFQGVDYVYHCAAYISFEPKEEEKLRKTNIEGTANIVNCCIDFGVKKLCYVSSIATLGDLKEHETIITEETEWNPEIRHSDYAISKYGAEMEVWRGDQEGLEVVVVNPGVILGPLFWNTGSGEIYDRVQKGLWFYTEGGTGFVSVDDVVRAMIALMNSDSKGQRFTLVAETLTYKTLIELLAHKLKVKMPRFSAQPWMTSVAWCMDYFLGLFGKKRMLSRDMAHTLHHVEYFDTSKVKQTLGIEFQPIANYIESK
ncbi:NAD-dependent epimerase/dehydratase family protein [Flavobacterium luminosum]|uniref:NAD-dependent epimerase/dehydratase family protein n=1 Tax=Flavobacterium luminosum TaxID=2949086 RepID=A0ABT0TPZ9_9FLAO|nr:NAD-dependent epimerase/dehydratase family protein [Flavobacterium sp. HXWNR70]MCL9809572.1 NAD-dependent epimerase/dehydratase family protein [Flavobacterium sp. HXWNR70]